MITNIFIALGTIFTPLGFALLYVPVSKYWAWACALIGFVSLIIAVFRGKKEDEETKAKMLDKDTVQALATAIQELRQATKDLPKEINNAIKQNRQEVPPKQSDTTQKR